MDHKRRVALAGTGHHGAGTWGRQLLRDHGSRVELVGLHDANSLRLARAREAIGTRAPAFTNLAEMLGATKPDTLIVCTRDDTHAGAIVAGLESGADVISEKPMATTAAMCRQILDAERRTGRRVEEPSVEDGYFRDACVFREEIDIFDTMTAAILYESGVQVAYSLNTFMPIEGYHLAFNGRKGRLEIRQYEKQPWATPAEDEILLMRNFGPIERVRVAHGTGGHFGGDPALQRMLFEPGVDDPLNQRAGARAGALSVLCGVAATMSATSGKPIAVKPLFRGMKAMPRITPPRSGGGGPSEGWWRGPGLGVETERYVKSRCTVPPLDRHRTRLL